MKARKSTKSDNFLKYTGKLVGDGILSSMDVIRLKKINAFEISMISV